MEIITRAEAKERGLKYYFTGKPCAKGHVSERKTVDGYCITCDREARKKRMLLRDTISHRKEKKPSNVQKLLIILLRKVKNKIKKG